MRGIGYHTPNYLSKTPKGQIMTKPEPKKNEEKVDWVQQIAERFKNHPLPKSDKPRGPDHEYLH